MYIMNINLQNSTKTTPYNIMFGFGPNLGLHGIIEGDDEDVPAVDQSSNSSNSSKSSSNIIIQNILEDESH